MNPPNPRSQTKPSEQDAALKTQVNWTTIRRWDRYRVDIRFKAIVTKGGNRFTVYGQGSDVSQGGMAAYIPSELGVGEVVELELSLPYLSGQQPIRIRASVRNRIGFRYGLEYSSIADGDRELLVKSLKALALTQ